MAYRLDGMTIAMEGQLAPNLSGDYCLQPFALVTRGIVVRLLSIEIPVQPPGSPWKTREELRQRLLEEDRWIVAMLVGWLQIKDD